MSELSLTAWAVLNAVTRQQYDLNPENVPNETARIAFEVSIALQEAVNQVIPKEVDPAGDWTDLDEARFQLLAIATELGAQ